MSQRRFQVVWRWRLFGFARATEEEYAAIYFKPWYFRFSRPDAHNGASLIYRWSLQVGPLWVSRTEDDLEAAMERYCVANGMPE